jgi:hypothetical protein
MMGRVAYGPGGMSPIPLPKHGDERGKIMGLFGGEERTEKPEIVKMICWDEHPYHRVFVRLCEHDGLRPAE